MLILNSHITSHLLHEILNKRQVAVLCSQVETAHTFTVAWCHWGHACTANITCEKLDCSYNWPCTQAVCDGVATNKSLDVSMTVSVDRQISGHLIAHTQAL
jgi:hypothetical protein